MAAGAGGRARLGSLPPPPRPASRARARGRPLLLLLPPSSNPHVPPAPRPSASSPPHLLPRTHTHKEPRGKRVRRRAARPRQAHTGDRKWLRGGERVGERRPRRTRGRESLRDGESLTRRDTGKKKHASQRDAEETVGVGPEKELGTRGQGTAAQPQPLTLPTGVCLAWAWLERTTRGLPWWC